jgi:hypothetical protein
VVLLLNNQAERRTGVIRYTSIWTDWHIEPSRGIQYIGGEQGLCSCALFWQKSQHSQEWMQLKWMQLKSE